MNIRLDPAPNSGDFYQIFSVRLSDNTLADLTPLTLELTLVDTAGCEVWRGSTSNGGLSFEGAGEFSAFIPVATFSGFCPGIYAGGCRASLGGQTEALFNYMLAITDGQFA